MADLNIAIKIAAQDRASAVIGRLRNTLGGVTSLVTGAALGGMAAFTGAVAAAGVAGLSMNKQMEEVTAQLNAFTKDGEKSAEILEMIRGRAAATPFAFREMASATAGLLPAAKQSGAELENLVGMAEILAASNPAQGLEGAAFALREAVSGDFTSIIERFNLPRQYINQLKDEGVPALEAVQMAMKEVGFDADLVANLAQTAGGRWSTFLDTLQNLAATVTQPIFDTLSDGLATVNDFLAANEPLLTSFATLLAGQVKSGIETVTGLARELVAAFNENGMAGVFELVRIKISEAWPGIQATLAEWGTRFWEWVTGPGGALEMGQGALSSIISTISQFLVDNWPTVQTALAEWGTKFWDWVMGPGGALERSTAALDALMVQVQTWVAENEGNLRAQGVVIGGYMMDALDVLFSNQEKVNSVVSTLLKSIGRAVFALISSSHSAGESLGTGIVNGIVDRLAGENASSAIITALKDLISYVFKAFNPIGMIRDNLNNLSGGASGGGSFIPGFASGGMVPGPMGAPTLAVVHGGEMVLNPSQQQALGGGIVINGLTINANDAAGGQAAADRFVDELRSRGLL